MGENVLILFLLVALGFAVSAVFYFLRKEILKIPISLVTIAVLGVVSLLWLDLSLEDLGFSNVIEGLLWGLAISITVAVGIFLLTRWSFSRKFFVDNRTKQTPRRKLFYRVFVDIPIATVLFEEILFRGLLFGFFQLAYGTGEAIVVSSALFGLWHVLPSLTFSAQNDKAPSMIPTILGTVLFTGLSGVVFAVLRDVSGSIIAPIALHYAVNTSSLLLSWIVGKNR